MNGDQPVRRATTGVRLLAVRGDHHLEKPDDVVTEEPLEIRAGADRTPVAVTMRTPGHDFELAVGFLVTEGLIAPDAVRTVGYCEAVEAEQRYNVVTVVTRGDTDIRSRSFTTTASCGVCGKASIDDVEVRCDPLMPNSAPRVDAATVALLPDRMRSAQRVFGRTGGLHAAALFDADGELQLLREDIGRHNAVDKLVGHVCLNHTFPLSDAILMVSGRISFEIVQKAAVARIPVLCAVSAPSSLAVDAARRLGLTLVGFVRDDSCNVYTHPNRIRLPQV